MSSPAAGIFLTHLDSPRIRQHFDRLVQESLGLVTWHFVLNPGVLARPEAPFDYPDPEQLLPSRHRQMLANGGVQGGYIDTVMVPVLSGLAAQGASHVWLCEYDVDFAGSWHELFGRFADNPADLLTSYLMFRRQQPKWPWWKSAGAPPEVRRRVRSLNPLARLSPAALTAYVDATADDRWQGHYEFTLPTAVREAGLVLEDFGGEGSFVPPGRERTTYIGKSPQGRPQDLTFGFRPVRDHYFHEDPEAFEAPGLLYHPVKPGVAAWTRDSMNVTS